jgi:hypothetical protein
MNKVICIDDTHKPNDISNKNWVKKNNIYTVVKMCVSKLTNDKYFVLDEIQPDNKLYGGFNVKRFSIAPEDIEELIENNELQLEEVE